MVTDAGGINEWLPEVNVSYDLGQSLIAIKDFTNANCFVTALPASYGGGLLVYDTAGEVLAMSDVNFNIDIREIGTGNRHDVNWVHSHAI